MSYLQISPGLGPASLDPSLLFLSRGSSLLGDSVDVPDPTGLPLYPDLPMDDPTVRPLNLGTFVRPSSGGTIRRVELDLGNTYAITVPHSLLTVTERDELLQFYADYQDNEFVIDPVVDFYRYRAQFDGEPQRQAQNGDFYAYRVQLRAVRLADA